MYLQILSLNILFALLIDISTGVEVKNIIPCENGPLPLSVSVNPCRKSYRKDVSCVFNQGNRVQVEAAFKAPFESNKLEIVATAQFKGHEMHLPESGNNACLYITPGCTMKKDQLYIFTYRFDIMKYYPTGEMPVKILIGESRFKKTAACASMKIEITENN